MYILFVHLHVCVCTCVGLICDYVHILFHTRGQHFRVEFSKLGEVRSLIPSQVNLMAMTATATMDTRRKIIGILGMTNPAVVAESPDKPN